jgi:predicted transcriptional regulator
MPAAKRTPVERNRDLKLTAEMYIRGKTQYEIASELGISQGQVNYDLKAIQAQWRESTTMNLDEAKGRELARLDELERTFWNAWEASKMERTKSRQETDGSKKDGKLTVKKASTEKEQRDGNPAFLAGVLSCIDRRCKLLGLDAPTKSELTGKDGGPIRTENTQKPDLSKLSLDELLQLRQMMSKTTDGITEPA